jgi:hypothetical protein
MRLGVGGVGGIFFLGVGIGEGIVHKKEESKSPREESEERSE